MSPAPEWMIYTRSFFALLFVAGLIVLGSALAKRIGLDRRFSGVKSSARRRLEVVETLYLDPRRRLVLVRMDAQEHLLLVSTTGDLLIESRPREAAHD